MTLSPSPFSSADVFFSRISFIFLMLIVLVPCKIEDASLWRSILALLRFRFFDVEFYCAFFGDNSRHIAIAKVSQHLHLAGTVFLFKRFQSLDSVIWLEDAECALSQPYVSDKSWMVFVVFHHLVQQIPYAIIVNFTDNVTI